MSNQAILLFQFQVDILVSCKPDAFFLHHPHLHCAVIKSAYNREAVFPPPLAASRSLFHPFDRERTNPVVFLVLLPFIYCLSSNRSLLCLSCSATIVCLPAWHSFPLHFIQKDSRPSPSIISPLTVS